MLIRVSRVKLRAVAAIVLATFAVTSAAASVVASAASPRPAAVQDACPDPTPGTAQCLAIRRLDIAARAASTVSPQGVPAGYGPADLQSAYGLPSGSAGSGMIVAIVDAFDLPTAEQDLGVYRAQYGLSACTSANHCFTKVDQNGGTSYPAPDAGWGEEIALDIDMVSAVCPNCSILLVEAADNSYSNLGLAVERAVAMGAVAVSNSYVGNEFAAETSYDHFYDHAGVAITAATGDCGYDCTGSYGSPGVKRSVGYPAASPHVIAVGGTTLAHDTNSRGWSESAWGNAHGGAGSGCSAYEPKPAWQPGGSCGGYRTEADVSAVADPMTGVAIVDNGLWVLEGGTSAAAPIVAATYALAGAPSGADYPARYLYADPSGLNDATGGNSDVTFHTCTDTTLCNAVTGFDGPTGLGTPHGAGAFRSTATVPGKPANLSATSGNTTVRLAWTAPDNGGSALTAYTVTRVGTGVVACTMTGSSSCVVGGLANGTGYTFTIHAANAVGSGPESDPSNSASPSSANVPDRPTGATAVGGPRSVDVSWLAPADDGGSPINGYTVTSTPDGKTCITAGALTCRVLGLTGGRVYTFTVTAANTNGTGPASDPTSTVIAVVAGTYHAMTPPVRVLDTRSDIGLSGKFVANTPRTFRVTSGFGIPGGAIAVTGNVTVTGSSGGWAVYLGPAPVAQPSVSTINFVKGDTVANGVTIALSSTGYLSATYIGSPGNTTSLVFDVTGYFTADDTGGTYHSLPPARIVDSRQKLGFSGGRLVANHPTTFAVWTAGGVPAGATAVTGNLTVTNSSNGWAIYLGPDPIASPATSTINFKRGQVIANNVTVALSSSGELSATFLSSAGNTTDLVFDVTGYYTPDLTGAQYVPVNPARLLDTRSGNGLSGKVVVGTPRTVGIAGRGDVPPNAVAVSANLTVVNETGGWAVYVGPDPVAKPLCSTLNFVKGDVRANGLTVALGSGGLSATYMGSAGGKTDLVLDVTGYFLP